MKRSKYIKGILALITCGFAQMAFAQAAAPAAAPAASASAGSGYDYLMYVILALAVVLLVAIVVLGQMLIRLSLFVYQKKDTIVKSLLLIAMLGIAQVGMSQAPAEAAAPAAAVQSSASGFNVLDLTAAMLILSAEILAITVLLIRIWSLLNIINPPVEKPALHFQLPHIFDRFNQSVAIEHESDILLDHDYDGIRELDNSLPPWWKWGFVCTIIWAVSYLTYYHVAEAAPLSAGEYANEMEAAKIAKDEYMRTAKNNVDENTIVFDASYVADGAKIFADNCQACHGEKGEGTVGPNLTDDFWLHGGKINDIFKTVKYGWPANGMKSWQSDLSSIQIAQVVCYVKSLHGTNPANGKAPQGEKYMEGDSAKAVSTADEAKK